jgi:hypothetical protein
VDDKGVVNDDDGGSDIVVIVVVVERDANVCADLIFRANLVRSGNVKRKYS